MHNDQTLIQNQTLNASRVFLAALACSVSVLCSLGSEHTTGILGTAHVTVPCSAVGAQIQDYCMGIRTIMVSLWKTKTFAISLLTFILQYVSMELVIIVVRCVRIFDCVNCCLKTAKITLSE